MSKAQAAISCRRTRVLASACLAIALGGCEAGPEPTMARMARDRELGAARAKQDLHRRELARLEQEGAAVAVAVAAAKAESVRRSAALRAVHADLQHQVGRLQTAERDLDAARARAAAIEQELQPLRDLERSLRDQEILRAEAAQRLSALQAEVGALGATAEQQEAALRPRLLALQQRLDAVQRAEVALAAANAAVTEALKVLVPPPAEPPPTPVDATRK